MSEVGKSCRNCVEFCRVGEGDNPIQLRGFCKKGRLVGDWSLYLCSSESRNCPSHLYASSKQELINIEERLSDLNFERKLEVPFYKDIKDFLAHQKTSFAKFCEIHRKEIEFVRNNADLTKQKYLKLIAEKEKVGFNG